MVSEKQLERILRWAERFIGDAVLSSPTLLSWEILSRIQQYNSAHSEQVDSSGNITGYNYPPGLVLPSPIMTIEQLRGIDPTLGTYKYVPRQPNVYSVNITGANIGPNTDGSGAVVITPYTASNPQNPYQGTGYFIIDGQNLTPVDAFKPAQYNNPSWTLNSTHTAAFAETTLFGVLCTAPTVNVTVTATRQDIRLDLPCG